MPILNAIRRCILRTMQTRSAIALILAVGSATQVVAADGSDVSVRALPADDSVILLAQAGGEVVESVPSLSAPGSAAPIFGGDASTGPVQRSATAGYELTGAGIGSASIPEQGVILTSTGRGRAIRFQNGIFVYPAVTAGIGHNDNVGGTSTNEKSSNLFVLRPEAVAELKRRGDRYTLSYAGNYGQYRSSSEDDFAHHDLWLAGDNYFTTRARMGWGVGYQRRSDARGSTDRAGASDSPDRWRAPVARIIGIYGAPKAPGRLELEASWMQKRYTNNRLSTRGSDVDMTMVAGRFFFRVMPKTSLVFEMRDTWSDYTLNTSPHDNRYRKLLAGVTWDMTAKTTGIVKLGRGYKDFDRRDRRDPSAGTWEATLVWSPLTYSVVKLQTEQNISDSTGAGNFTDNRGYSLNWDHKWGSFMTSNVNAGMVRADYDGISREDNTRNFGVGVYREVGHNFRVGVNWSHTKRDSSINTLDFRRNVTMLTLETVL